MNTQAQAPQKIYLSNYQRPDFEVDNIELWFNLLEDFCLVRSKILLKTNRPGADLVLDGVDLDLQSIYLNSENIIHRIQKTDSQLTIPNPPDSFELQIEVKIKPQNNTSLEGLYKSSGNFTTQCEAQGFRKITYFLDRPDVMTNYTVHIEADPIKYPVLLSNGDCVDEKKLDSGRKQITWKDPHKKPCYLFALVAGNLGCLKDEFITSSGRKVKLEIYAAHGKQSQCEFAMLALKKSMQWDEERFGREYDLSTYMIVAMDDFNAGAMENKGLNIFNSRLVLADPATATDQNYFAIESVIAHEYFHNWTGNRVTLRDWFHLSLKEGLTVFRDQEFSMDLHERAVIRIDTVSDLRSGQFIEDSGPNAHPIRPESCYAVDNFFTSTIYEKGSEIIRMMQTMVGRPGFRKGMDLYFSRHDGQAVIIEDFAAAISDANNLKWDQFKLWYSQAGTPEVTVLESYDSNNKTFELTLEQNYQTLKKNDTELKPNKPFHIPLVVGLVDSKTGTELNLKDYAIDLDKTSESTITINTEGQYILHLTHPKQTWRWKNINEKPLLSINRTFSAPIHLKWNVSDSDLHKLLNYDSDDFNRWEVSQKLVSEEILKLVDLANEKNEVNLVAKVNKQLLESLKKTIQNKNIGLSLKVKILEIPSTEYLIQLKGKFSPESFAKARNAFKKAFAEYAEDFFIETFNSLQSKTLSKEWNAKLMSERQMKNRSLSFLAQLPQHEGLLKKYLLSSELMTDFEAATSIALDSSEELRNLAKDKFYARFSNDSLTLNKWFALLARAEHSETPKIVEQLWTHPNFDAKNPNRVYSLLATWGHNLNLFHANNGQHYSWLCDRIVELDKLNPQVAARIAGAFDLCPRLPAQQQVIAKAELNKIIKLGLSKNCFEIVQHCITALD